jgi:UDP-N-acetylmuramoyl-L-alanyl-D-glutamate--2,6-diaminopimelate ligase
MLLSKILPHIEVLELHGEQHVEVRSVTRDSRRARPGSVFVAIVGATVDGHDFVPTLTGVAAVVVERPVQAPDGVCVVRVADTRRALPLLAAAIHGFPGDQMSVVGVTGTNGKTTVTTLVDEALRVLGARSARIGTTGTVVDGELLQTELTTPESTELQKLLFDMHGGGIEHVAMEVSSIGLDQRRVDGIRYAVGVFTNLSRDHLDFHGDMTHYRRAKARLFEELLRPVGGLPRALACADDPSWEGLSLPADTWLYGFSPAAQLRITELRAAGSGMALALATPLGRTTFQSALVGRFNALNLTAALGVCLLLGFGLEESAAALERVDCVPGRMEVVKHGGDFLVLVDYAHSPDALCCVLQAAQEVCPGQLWVVFGCGGDRDAGKRPQMGCVAEEWADQVVVTSDNPRNEAPLQIIDSILSGMSISPAHVDVDRESAIRWALEGAAAGDVVVIAGKGHETYQEIAGKRSKFDDRVVARSYLEAS